MINKEHLIRWIQSSLYSWFNDQLKDKITVFIETTEHVDKNGKITTKLPTWAEMRIDGPIVRQIHGRDKYVVTMNFLVETQLTGSNLYTHSNSVGLVYASFAPSITVFKLGEGIDDDQSPIGCFDLDTDEVDPIVIHNFGQLDPDVKLTQSTIEAHYCMYLDT
jgi:hypothetical protein